MKELSGDNSCFSHNELDTLNGACEYLCDRIHGDGLARLQPCGNSGVDGGTRHSLARRK
jgi:hypothetical protein